jgi:DDE superfamily endonuclease
MQTLPAELLNLIVVFQPLFTKPVWEHAKVLLLGALLARGTRTVTACLRAVGLGEEKHFQNYHRVLNRARWSAWQASRILFGLLLLLVPTSGAIVIGADDTIERRRGRHIKGTGCYRDPVRSSQKYVVKCFGLKWLCLMLLVKLPWSGRVWALPFLTVLCRARQAGQTAKVWRTKRRRQNKQKSGNKTKARAQVKKSATGALPRQHKSAIDILMMLMRQVRRWVPQRLIVLVVDGGYSAVKLALVCAQLPNVALVTRLRWDASLYHSPAPRAAGQRGVTATKGARQRTLKEWAARKDTPWEECEVAWYGGQKKTMKLFSRTALWYTPGEAPVEIRYVIARDPEGQCRDEVFACTKLDATPAQIIEWVVMRWSVEVTFEEARAHLGVETQRQWSDLAIARTTPCLLGLFSLVTLLTQRLQPDGQVPIQTAAWYAKPEATFSDCLVLVRKHLWRSLYLVNSAETAEPISFSASAWEHWLSCLAGAS